MTDKKLDDILFVYDGDCPVCQMGAQLFDVRANVGQVTTIDGRRQMDHPIMEAINQAGLNLDEGMVVAYQGHLYHGQGALHLMGKIGAKKGWFNRMNTTLFQYEPISKICYPFMRAARNMILAVKGVPKIKNLETYARQADDQC